MAIILVVDDEPTNRAFLITLLGYYGHRLLEAGDGAEALSLVHEQRPDLVIADILMPTMDGYEFAHQMRADPAMSQVPIIFYTAYYHEQEAQALAKACGVAHILTKPSEPEVILRVVDQALGLAASPLVPVQADFDREHLRLLTDKLSAHATELQKANLQLNALIEISLQLASEQDPQRLLEQFCHTARGLIGASYAAVGILGDDQQSLRHFFVSGIDITLSVGMQTPTPQHEILGKLLSERQPLRQRNLDGDPYAVGFPPTYPPIYSFLAAPIISLAYGYGWICLTNKLGADEFSDADERLVAILAAQVGRIYENGRLYHEAQRYAADLEQEVAERKHAEVELAERVRLAALGADVGVALTKGDTLRRILQPCAEAMVGHLDVAVARIWTLNDAERVLELQASAGMESNPDSPHNRVLVGSFEIGQIASERQPYLTNAVAGDSQISDQEWAIGAGIIAFVGYPLIVAERLVGVMALYARRPFTQPTYAALAALADEIALGVERKQTEEILRESEELYRLITEHSGDLISVLDYQGHTIYDSPSFQQILGHNSGHLIGISRFELVHPDDRPIIYDAWAELPSKGTIEMSLRFQHADRSWRWIEARATAMLRQGNVTIVMVGRDVTERRRLEEQFRQAQKIESIGQLAGGIAHDFNNMLAVVIGFIGSAQEQLPRDHSVQHELAAAESAAWRAARLTRQLLAFARKQIVELQLVNLNTVIIELDTMLRRLIGEDIELIIRPAPDLGQVKVDPGHIEQVIVNLVVNARDAMPNGGKLTIETTNAAIDDQYTDQHFSIIPGWYVMLAISDTGSGMGAEVQQHIFEPFFTTKAPGKGTGLGLATCYGIIKQHGGHIWVYSEVGHGTTFKIYLPFVEQLPDKQIQRDATLALTQGNEMVLLVEDEPLVRDLVGKILRGQGYLVFEAANGDEALRIAKRQANNIDLLITDVVLPGMGGKVLADHLTDLCPGMRILFISGYATDAITQHGQLDTGMNFLSKPFTRAALARKVREVLDALF